MKFSQESFDIMLGWVGVAALVVFMKSQAIVVKSEAFVRFDDLRFPPLPAISITSPGGELLRKPNSRVKDVLDSDSHK